MAKIAAAWAQRHTARAHRAGEHRRHAERHRTPQGDDEQSFREFEHSVSVMKMPSTVRGNEIDQRHQAAGQDEVERRPVRTMASSRLVSPRPIACAPRIETEIEIDIAVNCA